MKKYIAPKLSVTIVETKDIVTMSPVQTDGLDNWLKDVFSQEV